MDLLDVSDLRVDFELSEGVVRAVDGAAFRVPAGRTVALVGESGSGKSVVSQAIMGILPRTARVASGRIGFRDPRGGGEVDLLALDQAAMRRVRGSRISIVFQEPMTSLSPLHTVGDQVSEALLIHSGAGRREALGRTEEMLRLVGFPDPRKALGAYPFELSGGLRQRAVIAMALVCRPALLIADEPTTALDVTTQIEVLAAIKDVVRQFDTAAIYISHDLAVVAQMADRIMVLRHGNLVEEGTADSIVNRPEQEYTQRLLSVRTFRKPTAEPTAEEPLLRIEGISARYRRSARVLESIDLDIGRQRTVAIVGESGSGKSTLARVVTGLLPPEEGRLVFDGAVLAPALARRPRESLRRVQMIHQMPDTALNPRQRMRDVIGRPLTFYAGMHGRKRTERVRELLQMVELEPDEFIGRYRGELSGGQKQRMCIARALQSPTSSSATR